MSNDLTNIFDSKIFRVLSEPVRIEVLKVLATHGKMDVGQISSYMSQDRSVISRHLSAMREVGFLKVEKQGRHVFYEIDGLEILYRLEGISAAIRQYFERCCPGTLEDPAHKKKR